MLRIPCPHCGARDHSEFTYLGPANLRRPDAVADPAATEWQDYVFLRDNPRGPHEELWHHGHGCRSWIIVQRNTATHEILSSRLARTAAR